MTRHVPRAADFALVALFVPLAALAGPAVTVYTHDLGYVRETRALDLRAASDTTRIENVSEQLDFSSVRLTPADTHARVTRLAYRYDVASPDAES